MKISQIFAAMVIAIIVFSVGVRKQSEEAPQKITHLSSPPGVEGGNQTIDSFSNAKHLALKIYQEHPFTFYCHCYFTQNHIDRQSCNYIPYKDLKRASRLEWEHVVPAHDFGKSFVEWREGDSQCVDRHRKSFRGRKCAQKVSAEFRRMEADLYNLVPEVGEINARRGDLPMDLLNFHAETLTATCRTKITREAIEPRPEIRGFVARIYMYMDDSYPGRGIISHKNQKLFDAWNRMHPVDEWERKRAKKIFAIQKNVNKFVDPPLRSG